MLQRDQGKRAEQLSRRALLKGLGLGAGLVAFSGLSGCTQFLQRSESSAPLASAGAKGSSARKRLAKLAREGKRLWKEILRDYNRWQATRNENIKLALPEKIQKAKTSSLAVVDGLDTEGLTPELNEELAKADFSNVSEAEKTKVIKRIMEDLADTELPEDEAQKLKQVLMQPLNLDAKKKEVLDHGGISSYLRRYIKGIDSEALAPNSISYQLRAIQQSLCSRAKTTCMVLVGAALVSILEAEVWDDTYEAFFEFLWASFTCQGLLREYC